MSVLIRLTLLASFLSIMAGQAAYAYGPEPDLLRTKGYSPQLVQTVESQRARQEWRNAPPPLMSPKERFMHNVLYNNWTGGVDEFGSTIIREYE